MAKATCLLARTVNREYMLHGFGGIIPSGSTVAAIIPSSRDGLGAYDLYYRGERAASCHPEGVRLYSVPVRSPLSLHKYTRQSIDKWVRSW